MRTGPQRGPALHPDEVTRQRLYPAKRALQAGTASRFKKMRYLK
jgi:hypothetical protein